MEGTREINASFSKERCCFEDLSGNGHEFTSSSGPYEYLLGSLSGCYTATLFDALSEGTVVKDLRVNVKGRKRREVPMTLEETVITLFVEGCSDEDDFRRAAEQAERDCSIFRTIAGVSRMKVDLIFQS